MNSIFSASVFDATVIVDGHELFKGQGAANGWAEKLSRELEVPVSVRKIRTGWVLCGTVDGEECVWGVYGQRLKRLDIAAGPG